MKTEKLLPEIHRLREERAAIDTKLLALESLLVQSVQNEESLWDTNKAAEYLNVSRGQVDTLRNAGKLKARKIGGAIRFHPEDVRAFGQQA